MKQVHILLGGIAGPDGVVTSRGMYGLADTLSKLPGVETHTYFWSSWQVAASAMWAQAKADKTVLIGYSGGGTRATWLSYFYPQIPIDLMVLYDPSPARQMYPIKDNVAHALCYHNTRPLMWVPFIGSLGGGVLTGVKGYTGKIETVDFAQQHLLVQFNSALHARTVAAVKAL